MQPSLKDKPVFHCPESLDNEDTFLILKKIHFQRFNGLAYHSLATDGTYLYLYVSAINGGMYKIGTGKCGTKAGRIYLERQMHSAIGQKVEEVSWAYLKDKLYLKMSVKDPWHLEVINPNTFKR